MASKMLESVQINQYSEYEYQVNGHQAKQPQLNQYQIEPSAVKESVATEIAVDEDETPVNIEEESATKAFAEFVANTKRDAITPELSTKLQTLLLDYIGVTAAAGHAADSGPTIFEGVKAFAGSAQGNSTVLTKGSSFAPQYAALLNGTWSHTHDFDDTHAQGVLHPGCTVISAALAEAESRQTTGDDLLLSLTVGYEVACRIGISLGTGAYKRGFHNTSTSGIFGAVAAICKLRNLSPPTIESAFGLALSKSSGSMQFLDNGSWNKRLHPGFAAHDALLCVSLAQAGVLGASKALEGTYGATAIFSATGTPSSLSPSTLGSTWTFLTTSCKPFPACRMTHAVLEMMGTLRTSHPLHHSTTTPPRSITIHLPPANYPIVGLPTPTKLHPSTIVSAQFSIYFQTAAAWLHGHTLGMAIYTHLQDPAVHALSDKIRVQTDPAYKNLESRIEIEFKDGSVWRDEVVAPLGELARPFEWETGVLDKFLGLAEPVYGKERAEEIRRAVVGIKGARVDELMSLLA